MSRHRQRATRQRACTGKKTYPDRDAALAGIRGLGRHGAYTPRMEAYRCQWGCPPGSWHLGHGRGWRP